MNDADLVRRHLDGLATAAEDAALAQRLPREPELAALLRRAARRDCAIEAAVAVGVRAPAPRLRQPRRPRRPQARPWLWWMGLAAAAAVAVAVILPHRTASAAPPAVAGMAVVASGSARTVQGDRLLDAGAAIVPGTDLRMEGPCTLRLTDGSTFQVVPGTRLRCERRGYAPWLVLDAGALAAAVRPQAPDTALGLATPQAEVVVVGTRFTLAVIGAHTELAVDEGLVRLTARADGATRLVGAGQRSVADLIRFRRGINIGGGPVTIDGERWLGMDEARAQGLRVDDDVVTDRIDRPAQPPVDADMATMLATTCNPSQRPRDGDWELHQAVPDGDYALELWFQELHQDHYRTFDVIAEGRVVATAIGDLPLGHWRRYGPWTVPVRDGVLDLRFLRRTGTPDVMGLRLTRLTMNPIDSEPQGQPSMDPQRLRPLFLAACASAALAAEPATAPTDAGADRLLSWAPPALTDPITVPISDRNRDLRLDPAKDYVLRMPDTPFTAPGGLVIGGGRNVVLIGGEIRRPAPAAGEEKTGGRALFLKSQTGTIHIEGLLITGEGLKEGINLDQREGGIVQLQNLRIDTVHGERAGHHADLIQSWAGPGELRIDRFTGRTDYQGFFLLPNQHFDGPAPRGFDFRRMDITGSDTSAYLLWRQDRSTYPVAIDRVWVQPKPTRTDRDAFLWPKPSTGDRTWDAVQVGVPPGGAFVPPGVAGIGYQSPGYRK